MAELAVAYVQIVPSIKGISGAIENAIGAKPYKLPEPPVESWGTKIRGVLGGAFKAVGAIGAAAFAGVTAAIASYLPEAIAASDATDKFRSTLQFAGLGSKDIEKLSKSARIYADETVYSLSDIQNITAQLAANSVPNFDRLAEAAGNLNAIAGGNADTFKSVGMVLTQTAGQGKLTTENWNQLSNAIPGASGKIQEALLKAGAYTGNFRDAMSQGQITAEEFNNALLELGFDKVAVNAAKSTATFEGAWGNLEASVVGGLSDALNAVKPALTDLIGAVVPVVEKVSGVIVGFLERIDFSKINTGGLTGLLPVLGGMAGALGGLASQLPFIGSLFQGLSGPVGIVVGVFAGMIASSASLRAALGQVFQTIGQLVAQVAPLISQLLPSISILLAAFGDALAPIIVVIGQLVQALIPMLMPAIQTIIGALMDVTPVIAAVIASLGELAAWIAGQLMPIIEALLPVVQTILAGITGIVSGALEVIKGVVTTVMAVIKGDWAGAWNGIKSIVSGAWQIISSAVSSGISAVVQLVTTLPGKILGVLGNLGSLLYDSGRSLLQGLWNGISSAVGWVKNKISGALSSIRNLFPFSPAKEGPFSGKGWVLYSGLSIGEAMADGISRSTPRAVRAARGLSALTREALDYMAHPQAAMRMPDVYSAGVPAFSCQQRNGVTQITVNVHPEDLAGLRSVQEFVERAGEWATVKGVV